VTDAGVAVLDPGPAARHAGYVLDEDEVHSATVSAARAGVWSLSEERGRPKPLVLLVTCSHFALTRGNVIPGDTATTRYQRLIPHRYGWQYAHSR
jgi:hypothetical protein